MNNIFRIIKNKNKYKNNGKPSIKLIINYNSEQIDILTTIETSIRAYEITKNNFAKQNKYYSEEKRKQVARNIIENLLQYDIDFKE